jgi:hypothetical protein
MSQPPDKLASQLANYELASAALWLVLGIIQLASAVVLKFTAIAGIWNIFAAYTRFRASFAIRRRDPGIPKAFKPVWPLVAIGAVNLLVGGAIGVVFVLLDLYVRGQILENAEIFDGTGGEVGGEAPAKT